jgi:hypothetical protein
MGHAHQIKRFLRLVDFGLNRPFFRNPMACLFSSRYHWPPFVMGVQHVAKISKKVIEGFVALRKPRYWSVILIPVMGTRMQQIAELSVADVPASSLAVSASLRLHASVGTLSCPVRV